MEELVFEMLKAKRLVNDIDDLTANNEIEVNVNEVIVRGNKRGLILLSDYLVQIAVSDSINKYIHLDMDNFFEKANCELIICKE